MKRESIVKGVASWAGKNIKPRLPQFSVARLGLATFEKLAFAAPAAAEATMVSLAPQFGALLAAADGGQFDAFADALVAAANDEEKVMIALPGAMGPMPYSLSKTDFENIVNAIRTQEASA